MVAEITGLAQARRHRPLSRLLVGLFSAMARTLAAIGLYGVMAYMVSQRRREIGIRVAMGAAPSRVVLQILGSGAKLTLAGALLGLVFSALVARLAERLLFGVRPFDPATYSSAAAVLCLVAGIACVIPGHRVTKMDPVKALREY